MNKKIKVMKPSPLSDDEIRSYMNFEGLLQKRKNIVTRNRYQLLKWGMGLTGAVVLTIVMINIAPLTGDQSASAPLSPSEKDPQPSAEIAADTKDNHPLADSLAIRPRSAKPVERIAHDQKVENTVAARKDEIKAAEKVADVYVQAEPVDGYDALYRYFNENLIYPGESMRDSIQGVVTVSFTISSRGAVENVSLTNTLGEPFERETLKLIGNMPAWKPASLNGSPVPSKIAIPVTFSLQNVKP